MRELTTPSTDLMGWKPNGLLQKERTYIATYFF